MQSQPQGLPAQGPGRAASGPCGGPGVSSGPGACLPEAATPGLAPSLPRQTLIFMARGAGRVGCSLESWPTRRPQALGPRVPGQDHSCSLLLAAALPCTAPLPSRPGGQVEEKAKEGSKVPGVSGGSDRAVGGAKGLCQVFASVSERACAAGSRPGPAPLWEGKSCGQTMFAHEEGVREGRPAPALV